MRPRISEARSTAPAAIYLESDCTSLAKDSERTILRQFFLVEVGMKLDSGLVWRIIDAGWFSRNRVVLVFDPKGGWLVVGTWLLNGWKMVVEHFCRG